MAAVWRTFSACRSRWMAWWGETTDIVFLNSPWVKRPFGRGFRIAWMLITLICVASQPDIGAMFLFVSEIKTIFLIFTWYFWVASLWSLGNSSWESLSGSFLFSVGVLLSTQLLAGSANTVYLDSGTIWIYAFVVPAHCSMHPVAFIPTLMFSCFYCLQVAWDAFTMDPVFPRVVLYSQFSVIILFAMFCLDFAARSADYSVMMRSDGDSESMRIPTVEGTSCCRLGHSAIRICCYLVGANNWIFWLAIVQLKYWKQRDTSLYIWEDHLPACTFAAPCLGVFSFTLAWMSPAGTRADCGLAMFCFLPGAVLMLDWTVVFWAMKRQGQHAHFYSFAHSLMNLGYLQCLVSIHALSQSGCRVWICFLLVAIFTVTNIPQWFQQGVLRCLETRPRVG